MPNIKIPDYIKRMGHEFFCYVFNLDEQQAKNILNGAVVACNGYSAGRFYKVL